MEYILARLRDAGVIKGEIVACDATFIKAYSKRDPEDDSRAPSTIDLLINSNIQIKFLGSGFSSNGRKSQQTTNQK